jgi:hypothetical protein
LGLLGLLDGQAAVLLGCALLTGFAGAATATVVGTVLAIVFSSFFYVSAMLLALRSASFVVFGAASFLAGACCFFYESAAWLRSDKRHCLVKTSIFASLALFFLLFFFAGSLCFFSSALSSLWLALRLREMGIVGDGNGNERWC